MYCSMQNCCIMGWGNLASNYIEAKGPLQFRIMLFAPGIKWNLCKVIVEIFLYRFMIYNYSCKIQCFSVYCKSHDALILIW